MNGGRGGGRGVLVSSLGLALKLNLGAALKLNLGAKCGP